MDFDAEIARWHRFSDGAIGSTGALLTLFLATTPSDLRERLHDKIMAELQTRGTASTAHWIKSVSLKQ